MSTVVDYAGRTVDLLAFQDEKVGQAALLTQLLVKDGERGEITTGIQKLAQRWLVEFLTIRGSLRAAPTRGSRFIEDLRTGQIRTTVDAEQSFYLSARQVETSLKLEEESGIPSDEAYRSVELENIAVTGDQISVTVLLSSVAGGNAQVIFPIPIKVL